MGRDRKVPSVLSSCIEDSWGFCLVLGEHRKKNSRMPQGTCTMQGIYLALAVEGSAAMGRMGRRISLCSV